MEHKTYNIPKEKVIDEMIAYHKQQLKMAQEAQARDKTQKEAARHIGEAIAHQHMIHFWENTRLY